MKSVCLLVVLALFAVATAQRKFEPFQSRSFISRNPSTNREGAYTPENSGAYRNEDGRYHPDNSGQYVHSDDKYKHQDYRYVHQADKFGKDGSDYSGQGDRGTGATSGGFPGSHGSGPAAGGVPPKVTLTRPTSGVAVGAGFGSGSVTGGFDQGGSAAATGKYDNRNYKIIRKIETVEQDGYHYLYETENGITGEEQGKLANVGKDDVAMKAHGFYTYTGPDNVVYTVRYTADENGFVPEADHIPTPPPIPDAILRALEYQRSVGKL